MSSVCGPESTTRGLRSGGLSPSSTSTIRPPRNGWSTSTPRVSTSASVSGSRRRYTVALAHLAIAVVLDDDRTGRAKAGSSASISSRRRGKPAGTATGSAIDLPRGGRDQLRRTAPPRAGERPLAHRRQPGDGHRRRTGVVGRHPDEASGRHRHVDRGVVDLAALPRAVERPDVGDEAQPGRPVGRDLDHHARAEVARSIASSSRSKATARRNPPSTTKLGRSRRASISVPATRRTSSRGRSSRTRNATSRPSTATRRRSSRCGLGAGRDIRRNRHHDESTLAALGNRDVATIAPRRARFVGRSRRLRGQGSAAGSAPPRRVAGS